MDLLSQQFKGTNMGEQNFLVALDNMDKNYLVCRRPIVRLYPSLHEAMGDDYSGPNGCYDDGCSHIWWNG